MSMSRSSLGSSMPFASTVTMRTICTSLPYVDGGHSADSGLTASDDVQEVHEFGRHGLPLDRLADSGIPLRYVPTITTQQA